MPRARKTQPVEAAAGQAYGERQAQEQAQEQLPVAGAPVPASGPGGVPVVNPGGDAQAAALAMPPPDLPPWAAGPVDEPITHGLPIGEGPGPEVLGLRKPNRAPVADMLLAMARATGDPRYAEMAQRAGA